MEAFIESFVNYKDIIILLFSIVLALSTVIVHQHLKTSSKKHSKDLSDLVKKHQIKDTETAILDSVIKLPSDLPKEEFLIKLRAMLSSICYVNMKNEDDSNEKLSNFLDMHHQQALTQSTIQFWLSIVTALIGFAFIIFMILSSNSYNWYDYIVKSLPGAITQTVSVLFFKQAHDAREKASEFFKSLNDDRQIAKSIAIADSIDDETTSSRIKAQIALHSVGIKNTVNV